MRKIIISFLLCFVLVSTALPVNKKIPIWLDCNEGGAGSHPAWDTVRIFDESIKIDSFILDPCSTALGYKQDFYAVDTYLVFDISGDWVRVQHQVRFPSGLEEWVSDVYAAADLDTVFDPSVDAVTPTDTTKQGFHSSVQAVSDPSNFIFNPSFEDSITAGAPAGWDLGYVTTHYYSIKNTGTATSDGRYYAKFDYGPTNVDTTLLYSKDRISVPTTGVYTYGIGWYKADQTNARIAIDSTDGTSWYPIDSFTAQQGSVTQERKTSDTALLIPGDYRFRVYVKGAGGGAGSYASLDACFLSYLGSDSSLLASSAIDDIYDEDTTGHGIADSFGKMLKDTLAYQAKVVTALPVTSEGESLAVEPEHWTVDDSAAYQGAAGILDSQAVYEAMAQVIHDSSLGGCIGAGPVTVKHYLYDDTGAAFIPFATVGVISLTGELAARVISQSGGYGLYNMPYNDTLIVAAFRPGYVFPIPDTVISSTADTVIDTLHGYSVFSASTCEVYMYAADLGADILTRGPRLLVELKTDGAVYDRCNNTVVARLEKWSASPDVTGKLSLMLRRNKCMSDTLLTYHAWIHYRGGQIELCDFTVPDTSSFRLSCE